MDEIKSFCKKIYSRQFKLTFNKLCKESKGELTEKKAEEFEVAAQKEAIKQTIIEGLKQFPDENAAEIWRAIYEVHVHKKSGLGNSEIIRKVISADQSWKKSSGHAFEEMVKALATDALRPYGIEIVLQRDLNILIKADEIANEPRDISWLKEQIGSDVFDLYAIIDSNGKRYCFGCIQCKTSIRDRVTRDREPSQNAMKSYFWSAAIVLDGDFLKLPKFHEMVNGGSINQQLNGWHGMYIFTKEASEGRIYQTNVDLDIFREHAVKASDMWLHQRQWFDATWKAEM